MGFRRYLVLAEIFGKEPHQNDVGVHYRSIVAVPKAPVVTEASLAGLCGWPARERNGDVL